MAKIKSKSKNLINKIILTCCIFMLVFSVFKITKVFAGIENIIISNATIEEKSTTVDASISSFNSTSINSDVTYYKLDDYVIYKITIKNNDSQKYTIKTITDNNSYTHLLYEYDKHENEDLDSNAELDLTIKVTYKNTVTDMTKRNVNNPVSFTITFIGEDGEEDEKVVPINPTTGDNLILYISLGIISIIGLALVTKKKKINKLLLILLLIPFGIKAATLSYTFNFNNEVKLFDKMLVTVDVNGTKQEVIVPYNTKMEEPETVIRPGYNFLGWYSNDELFDFNQNITTDVNIEAKYEIITYGITYNLDGGNATNPANYTVEDQFTLNNPTKQGYNFAGWTGSNGEGLQTSVTVNKGTTGDLSYVAHFSERDDIPYLVIHKYQNLDDPTTWTTEEQPLTGVTGSTVYPETRHKDGFIDPAVQSLEILPDGSASIEYEYTRVPCAYAFNENVTSNLEAGTYPYGTEVTVTAKNIDGYTFSKWEDNSTANPRTITLTGNTNVVPTYIANEDTPYLVVHKYQNLDDLTTFTDENEPKTGETATTVYPSIRHRNGFADPAVQSLVIAGDGSARLEYYYYRETYTYSFGENVTSTKVAGTYPYETSIEVTANNIAGYTFTEWEDGSTANPRTITLSSNTSVAATYTANTNTPYTVNHYTQKINGDYELVEMEPLTGTTGQNVTPAVKSYTGFTAPSTETKKINGNGSTTFDYYYTRDKHTLTLQNTSDIVEGNVSGQYYYEEQITLTAKDKVGYTFTGWSNGESTKQITITMGATDITVGPEYSQDVYTVSFDTQGGTPVSAVIKTYGQPIGEIDETTKDGYTFDGWYTHEEGGTQIDETTLVTATITYFAHWTENTNILCKKAVSLHTETCTNSDTTKGCGAGGYSVGDTITFGNIISSDTYALGDAFDCNVDGSGYNQRFYYIRTLNNKAVLISNTNYTAASGQGDINSSFIYSQAHDQLPTTTDWGNLTELFDGKPARLITLDDIYTIAGTTDYEVLKVNGSLEPYIFLFENSNYSGVGQRSTQWLEEVSSTERYRYRNDQRNLARVESGKENTSLNPVRPVIEIPLDSIEDTYVVRFNPAGGTLVNEYVNITKGSTLGTLPTPTRTGFIFEGWYAANEDQISTETIPTGYETYHAEWLRTVEGTELVKNSFNLSLGDEEAIEFVETSDLEARTFTSNDESVVTVDANGNITTVGEGTTSITITGTISHTSKAVTVVVQEAPVYYMITFDSDGGEEVAPVQVARNTAAPALPSTTKTGNVFDGWYTDTTYATEIKEGTIINDNMTVIAKWVPDDIVAVVNGTDYYTSIQTAIDSAPNVATVKIYKDAILTTIIDLVNKNTSKNIVLDLNGHTLTNNTTQVIRSKATLEVKNGNIVCGAGQGAIDITGGHFTINSGRVEQNGTTSRAAIYNDGGVVEIGGTVYLTAKADGNNTAKRATVQNVTGTTIITGGTIISTRASNSYGVSINAGTLRIGTKDDTYDTENLIIQANTQGIYADVDYALYDGMVKGKSAAVNNESKITLTEDNFIKVTDLVDGFNRLYYEPDTSSIKLTLDPNGGEVDPTYINISSGDEVGILPTPTRGAYTFDGWYDENDQLVLPTRMPTESETYTAQWSYTSSDTVVNFDMTNDVIRDYYTNIDSWKQLSESDFETAMLANFNSHGCSSCNAANNCKNPTAGEKCERSKGYDTGIGEALNVYEYDASTDTKTLITYTTSDDGIIYNMIPGLTYRWELATDSNVYGYVQASGERRTIYSTARNVRDLGGMDVSFVRNNVTKTGTLKYNKLYRGAQIENGQTDVDGLVKLGITREVDLRADDEQVTPVPVRFNKYDKCDVNCSPLNASDDIVITNYLIYPETYRSNYDNLRDAMKFMMNSVVNGDSIYFHCTIGSDRTGTIAYFLEGLLGVPEEQRVEDYELSFFYGMTNRHRYHDNLSGSSINPRFKTMHETYDTNEKIYNWYMYGLTEEQKATENVLIEQFRDAMIDYNN